MYKPDLALNNPQWFICHKTKPNPSISQVGLFQNCLVWFGLFGFMAYQPL